MVTYKLLDLFCCEGGASQGYHEAGFRVTGVDNDRHVARRYPYNLFIDDALDYVRAHGHKYDAIHASPPCQGYSVTASGLTARERSKYPAMVAATRAALRATGKPYVIENVVGAPLYGPVLLCGSMFELVAPDTDGTILRLERHRIFEASFPLDAPGPCRHDPNIPVAGVYGGGRSNRVSATRGGYTPLKHVRKALMGVHNMSQLGLSEAIPPAYTRHIGAALLRHLEGQK